MAVTDQAVLDYVAAHPGSRRGEIKRHVAEDVSAPTVLRAELDSPDKTTLVYRDFVRNAVRRNVLEWHGFRRDRTLAMAVDAGIPDADREQVANYIANEIRGLHEGNAIRYRLTVEDLVLIGPPGADNAG